MSGVELLVPVLTAAASAGAGAVASSALQKTPNIPRPKAPARMPTEDSPEALEERRRREAELRAGRGRQSTILTGGPTFSNTQLGQ